MKPKKPELTGASAKIKQELLEKFGRGLQNKVEEKNEGLESYDEMSCDENEEYTVS